MFIRYVSSKCIRFIKSMNTGKAAVLLLVLVVALTFTGGIAPVTKHMSMNGQIYNMVCRLYNYSVSNSSNAYSYNMDSKIDVKEEFYSNLYAYTAKQLKYDLGMDYIYKDVGYQIADMKIEHIPIKDEKVEDEKETTVQQEVESQTQVVEDDKGIDGYVVPAVSSAGVTYSKEQLTNFDFLMAKLYTVPSRALVYESDLVAEKLFAKDTTMKGDNTKPQILIYHTHSQEEYADSKKGDDTTTIVAVGTYLAKILSEEYGYNVIHCTEHFDIAGGHLDRSKAYTYAQATLQQILEDNPSIEVVLDIHRDGLPDGYDKLLTNIGGKDVAKIMLFNGISRSSASGDIGYLYNRYQTENLAFSFKLKLKAMECYPEFTRRNYIDAYQYNLHHRPKSVLVEVGAQNNTLQEALNAMEVFSEVLHRVLNEK